MLLRKIAQKRILTLTERTPDSFFIFSKILMFICSPYSYKARTAKMRYVMKQKLNASETAVITFL